MKSLYKRIIAGAVSLVTLFFVCMPPVYASDSPSVEVSIETVGLFDWLVDGFTMGANWLKHFFDDDICPGNPNYESRHNFVERRTQVDGKTGLYYICEYCGKSAGEVAKQAYNDYVGTLPATGWTSNGHLIWHPTVNDLDFKNCRINGVMFSDLPYSSKPSSLYRQNIVLFSDSVSVDYVCEDRSGTNWVYNLDLRLIAPLGGRYYLLETVCTEYSVLSTSGVRSDSLFFGPSVYPNSEWHSSIVTGGKIIQCVSTPSIKCDSSILSGSFYLYFPYIEIAPDIPFGDTYTATTRPTTITGGNYGIVGDDGQLTVVNGDIINETNNTYYNPATGQSGTINNWSYDYSDRSYNLTLDSGNTVTVRYGDENITIIEGDVTYNIYYIIEGSVDDCTHEWYQTGHREGNCLTAEQRTYTCSKCNKQYTETDPAPGHSWRIIQEVSTKYDESGNLIQEGYTIYECERCKEQYKATNDTGPPPSGGGGSDTVDNGGLLEWINGLIKYLSDHLSGAVDLILSFFREIPGMFGGFLDFLSAMFPFLPDDVVFLFTFGIAAVVFIGIIKALRR